MMDWIDVLYGLAGVAVVLGIILAAVIAGLGAINEADLKDALAQHSDDYRP